MGLAGGLRWEVGETLDASASDVGVMVVAVGSVVQLVRIAMRVIARSGD